MTSTLTHCRRARWALWILGLAAVLGIGLWLRSLSPATSALRLANWWPWTRTTAATLFFADGHFLFPVSRRMPANDDLPHAVLQALLGGPRAGAGLQPSVPSGVQIRSIQLADGLAQLDLSAAFLEKDADLSMAQAAIVDTMTALPGVSSVTLSVEGKLITESARRTPLLYYPSAKGLVAVRGSAVDPRSALAAYLSGPDDPELTGFPSDVRLLNYAYEPIDRRLALRFTYSSSVRTLALERPERMRALLLGLITTLTEFPEVRTVQLDFQGQTRLGLGQCSDLLRTPQPRPQLLNDERLL
jgi:spore germination protein GerM